MTDTEGNEDDDSRYMAVVQLRRCERNGGNLKSSRELRGLDIHQSCRIGRRDDKWSPMIWTASPEMFAFEPSARSWDKLETLQDRQ